LFEILPHTLFFRFNVSARSFHTLWHIKYSCFICKPDAIPPVGNYFVSLNLSLNGEIKSLKSDFYFPAILSLRLKLFF